MNNEQVTVNSFRNSIFHFQLLICLLFILAVQLMGQNPDSGLVAHYPLNDGNADDVSPYNNDGTGSSLANIEDRFGNQDQACFFFNAEINVPHHSSIDFTVNEDFSITGWVNTIQTSQYWIKILAKNPGLVGYSVFLQPSGKLFAEIGISSNWYGDSSNVVINDGKWHHFAFIVNRTNDIIKLYLNGEYAGQDSFNDTLDISNSSSFNMANAPFSNRYIGSLDDIRIYDRIITEAEIDMLYYYNGWADTSRSVDSLALVALYDSLGGDGWTDKTNWKSANPIDTWYGLTITDNRVTEINMQFNNLIGQIPPEIGDLTGLITLTLSNNNSIDGNIPPEISQLTNLYSLSLGNNSHSGGIPAEICYLPNLRFITLFGNSLTSIPSEIENLPSLTNLNLSNNLITSIPPEVGNISGLDVLVMDGNLLDSIPNEIGDLSGIRQFQLRNNLLSDLPDLSGLTSLQYFKIENNRFTFEDIEPLVGLASDEFTYSPQDSVGSKQDTTINEGENLSLSVDVGGDYNLYRWFHDGILINDSTNSSLSLTNVNTADEGDYICEITNTVATELTLYNRPFQVMVIQNIPPEPPTLISPADNATGQMTRPILAWNTSSGADTYHLQVSTSSTFSTTVFDNSDITTTSRQVGPLANNRIYYWRISAGNDYGVSAYSEIRSFTTFAAPTVETVSIISSFNSPGSRPTGLTWDGENLWMIDNLHNVYKLDTLGNVLKTFPLGNSTHTDLSWDGTGMWYLNGSAVGLLKIDTSGVQIDTLAVHYWPNSGIEWDGKYFWIGNYNDGVIHKHAQSGTELLNFDANIFGHPTGITFDGKNLWVGTSAEGGKNEIFKFSITGETLYIFDLETIDISADPASFASVAWDGHSLWYSSDDQFTIYRLSVPYYHSAPAVPTLVSPQNGASEQSLTPTLSWNVSLDAVNYRLQVSTISTFSTTAFDDSTITTTAKQVGSLLENTTYFWHVSARNSGGTSAYSNTWTFTTLDMPPSTPQYLTATPGNQQITLNFNQNIESDLNKYNIYRDTSSPATTLIDSVIASSPSDTIYVDTGLISGQVYYYRIKAVDNTGNESNFSNEVSAIPEDVSSLQDSLALVALYDSTNGANWTNNTNWLTGPISTWFGIIVSDDRVTEIILDDNNLAGTIPPEIGNLTNLSGQLVLCNNQLSGFIPTEIGNLINSVHLDIENNQLTGEIPPEIGNLINLQGLYLSGNQLTGLIPAEIGNLTNLNELYLINNSLSGTIPTEIGNLTNLTDLYLSYNSLSGSIPTEFTNLANLESFSIDNNQFNDLPELSSMTSLTDLRIQDNQFTFEDIEPNIGVASTEFIYSPQDSVGAVRDTLVEVDTNPTLFISVGGASNQYQWYKGGTLVSGATANPYTITSVDYSDAGAYTCLITNTVATELTLYSRAINLTVVASIREIDSLALVALYDSTGGDGWTDKTNWKTANPIDTWYGITVADNRVSVIFLPNNNLVGSIPPEIGNLTNLTFLIIGDNQLTGLISSVIGNLINLENLQLNNNQFSGSIPAEIGNLSNLQQLNLQNNQLSGSIPIEICDLTNLILIDFNENQLADLIPVEIGNMTNLAYLNLSHNQLIGAIPTEIGNLTNLIDLSCRDNKLTGEIPPEIGNLTNLASLDFFENQLTGSIPVEIGNLVNLNNLYLMSNHLSGTIPDEIGNLTNLTGYLGLQSNEFTGTIPSSLGNLINLHFLWLFENKLEGAVPGTFTNLAELDELEISNNQLTDLPDLSSLDSLAWLKIEHNKFTFEDIEPNIGVPSEIFTYTPQDSVGSEKDTTIFEGSSLSYAVTVGGANNVYQWYKDANPISGATTSTLNIATATTADNGVYTLQITNTVATDLTLYSRPLTIAVGALPTISTTGNYDIRVTTSGLVTEVNPNNLETLVYFEYGTTTSYGTDTSSEPDTLWGDTIQEVSKNIYGLIKNTTYHFRTVAENAAGTQFGPDNTFTTNNYSTTGNSLVATIDYLPQNGAKENYSTSDYRLFGLPGSSVIPMANIMPGSGDNEWIAYYDDGSSSGYKIKYDGSSTFDFSLGKAFWVICQQDININETVNFPNLNADDEIAIPLRSGWNLITNPFAEPVEWAEITSRNGDITYPLWEWTGGWNNPLYIEPYKGYMIFNENNLSSLNIIYPVASSKRKAAEAQYDWAIHVHMTSKDLSESALHFGIAPDAEFTQDKYDYHKPRMFSDMPGTVFTREKWDEEMPDFATDFRPEIETIQTWSMNTVMPIGKAVEFYFESVEAVPDEYSVMLIDRQQRSAQDLREDPVYKITSSMRNRQFDILVGNPEEIDEILAELVVNEFVLEPNFPNPFNPTTVIPIELPEMTRVELTVYDILGQRVKILHKGELNSGRHLLTWDGTNGAGIKVASGVYLYRIKTGSGFTAVRKMVLMK